MRMDSGMRRMAGAALRAWSQLAVGPRRLGYLAALALSVAGAGCADTQSDQLARPEDAEPWQVTAAPVLTIGASDGTEPAYLFTRISGAARLSDGRIVVAEESQRELRFFGADGVHLRTVGGKGGGPGEFSHQLAEIQILPGDTILAFQSFDVPWTSRFTDQGDFVDQWRFDPRLAWRPGLNLENDFELLADGRLAFQLDTMKRSTAPEYDRLRKNALTLIVDRDRNVDTVGWRSFPRGTLMTFSRRILDGRGSALLTDPDRPMIWSIDLQTGRLDSTTWDAGPRTPVTDSMKTEFIDRLVGSMPSAQREQWRSRVALPDSLPYFAAVLVAPDGNYWIEELPSTQDATGIWRIRDKTGKAVGRIRLPKESIMEVGDDYVLTVARDEEGVPYVRMYSLSRRSQT